MRIGALGTAFAGALMVGACGETETRPAVEASAEPAPAAVATITPGPTPRPGEAALPAGGLPPFAERAGLERERGSWLQQLEPNETEYCTFTEKPVSQRPNNLVVSAWSGNMDLWSDGYVLAHDHAIGFVEAMWMKRKPVIAARDGMPDLWIEPVGDFTNTILRIGPDELTCVRWEG